MRSHSLFIFILFIFSSLIFSPDIVYFLMYKKYDDLFAGLVIGNCLIISIFFINKFIYNSYPKILFLAAFISPIFLFPILYFKVRLTKELLVVIFTTDFQEAYELLHGYLLYYFLLYIIYILAIFFIYKVFIRLQPIYQNSYKIISCFFISFFFIFSFLSYGISNPLTTIKNEVRYNYPGYVFSAFNKYFFDIEYLKHYNSTLENFHFFSKFRKHTDSQYRKVYVLFIGESSRYDHWHINGYSRFTSPNLDTIKNLLSFKDVCAAGGLTEYSVPLILCGLPPDKFRDHVKRRSLVFLFREAGFHTYWITNQTDDGNISTHIKDAYSLISIRTYYLSQSHIHYDQELIDKFDTILHNNRYDNVFVLIHSLGSHYNYSSRYTRSFSRFNPSNCDSIIYPTEYTNKEILINAYDNSILYTDFVIYRTICLLSKLHNTLSFLFYISDHGENLFDNNRMDILHGTFAPSIYISHIPLFIWYNDYYGKIYPDKVVNIKKNLSMSINASEDVFYTLSDLADLSYHDFDSSRSFSSPFFSPKKHVILGGDGKIYHFNSFSQSFK